MSGTILDENLEKNTQPATDELIAEKGGQIPAPMPEGARPNRTKDVKKAQAMLDGEDPETIERLEQAEEGEKLIKMVKDGRELPIHPSRVKESEGLGWRIAEGELDEFETDADKAKAPARKRRK